jgi:predicted DNA binding CopG/RHH family protein
MSGSEKILGTDEAWETDKLGNDPKYAKAASLEITKEIDEALCLQSISIRLEKRLIDSFKVLADFHGVGYQPLMRDALNRFANAEMKAIVSGFVESQRKHKPQKKHHVEEPMVPHKKVA